jgi:uncharacterized protein with PQ loop repeat
MPLTIEFHYVKHNTTGLSKLSIQEQEIFGWIGNFIFIIAQLSQVWHTHKVKRTKDLSYILQCMFIIGNIMYTAFGLLDNSISMFVGNGISLGISFFQIGQKIYYDHFYELRDIRGGYMEIT